MMSQKMPFLTQVLTACEALTPPQVVEDICGTSDGFLQKDEAGESLGFEDSKISTLDGKYVGLYFTQGDMKDLTFTGYETRPCVTFTEKLKEARSGGRPNFNVPHSTIC